MSLSDNNALNNSLLTDQLSLAGDAASIGTVWSTNFKHRFEWLFLADADGSHGQMSSAAFQEKQLAILQCLNGQDGVVDLWKLRQLALSPGGLLSADLRKRAYPILTASHEQVLMAQQSSATTTTTSSLVAPSQVDMQALKYNVSKTIWNVQEHLAASRSKQATVAADNNKQQDDDKLQAFCEQQRKEMAAAAAAHRTVSFAADKQQQEEEEQPPQTIATTPTSTDEDGDDDDDDHVHQDEPSVLTHDDGEDDDEEDNMGHVVLMNENIIDTTDDDHTLNSTFCPSESTVLTQETSFTLSSRAVRWRKASVQEQKILFNVILSVLRTSPAESCHYEDDRYHYYAGLQDLTALLMINLESPSLSSLVLGKLAVSHLRDAMRGDLAATESALQLSCQPLLQSVDPILYEYLQTAGMTAQWSFCRQWVSCWFAQDVPDCQTASRLLDVFLVSHPLMPIYVSVALLTVHRDKLLQHDNNNASAHLYTVLRSLPMQTLVTAAAASNGDSMAVVEKVIATAVDYMKQLPPAHLITMSKNRCESAKARAMFPAIAMFQTAPAWSTADAAPNDYAVLQRAKALRAANNKDKEEEPASDTALLPTKTTTTIHAKDYSLAMAAAGLTPSHHRYKTAVVLLILLCTAAAGLVFITIAKPRSAKVGSLASLPPAKGSARRRKNKKQPNALAVQPKPLTKTTTHSSHYQEKAAKCIRGATAPAKDKSSSSQPKSSSSKTVSAAQQIADTYYYYSSGSAGQLQKSANNIFAVIRRRWLNVWRRLKLRWPFGRKNKKKTKKKKN